MFIVKPAYEQDLVHALTLIGYHQVKLEVMIDDPEVSTVENMTLIVELKDDNEDDLRNCEMTFQGEFHQGDALCTLCKEKIVNDAIVHIPGIDRTALEEVVSNHSTCGHLTFTHRISPAF